MILLNSLYQSQDHIVTKIYNEVTKSCIHDKETAKT